MCTNGMVGRSEISLHPTPTDLQKRRLLMKTLEVSLYIGCIYIYLYIYTYVYS